jgi:hypothetical protein
MSGPGNSSPKFVITSSVPEKDGHYENFNTENQVLLLNRQ